jgi:hypothetical protein
MEKSNVINLAAYREQSPKTADHSYPADLVSAIEELIQRLRECGPFQQRR